MSQDEEWVEHLIAMLTGELNDVLNALMVMRETPLPDERIVPYVEAYLNDTQICYLSIPYIYGEVRWLAAEALVQTWAALGIHEPVRLTNVIAPLSGGQVFDLMKEAGLDTMRISLMEGLSKLRDLGKAPTRNWTFWARTRQYPME